MLFEDFESKYQRLLNQRKLIKFCTDRDIIRVIITTAYCPSPLWGVPYWWQKQPAFLHNVKLKEIADKYNKIHQSKLFDIISGESVLVSSIWRWEKKAGFYSIKNFNGWVKFFRFFFLHYDTKRRPYFSYISFVHLISVCMIMSLIPKSATKSSQFWITFKVSS